MGDMTLPYDVIIVGGGPAGLSAALALGRARKRVLLCDSGPRRNAAAEQIHNFVTRDGTPPDEFRRVGRQQLETYPNVEARDTRVDAVAGAKGSFRVTLGSDVVEARRLILCTGLVDEMLPIDGFSQLWGHGIVQCPYCHGWETQDRIWGFLAVAKDFPPVLPFALQLRGWTDNVVVFTNGADVPDDTQKGLQAAGVRLATAPLARLVAKEHHLDTVELSDGTRVRCDMLFAHPPQRQVELVRSLGVALDEHGFVQVDPMRRETSIPGIYAAGDLTTAMQSAVFGAAAGVHTAAACNLELTMELASNGKLSGTPR
jgi:thioredoxin reductase